MYRTHSENFAANDGDLQDPEHRGTTTSNHFRNMPMAQSSEAPRPFESTTEPSDVSVNSEHENHQATSPQAKNDHAAKSWWEKTRDLWVRVLDYLQDSWFLELAACVLALALFGAEIGILVTFDGRNINAWPWRWSLNSAVALFTTLLESLLLFALVSCLGHMKWLWFCSDQVEKKRLICIDLLARSNTPVGALSLLLLHATTWKNVLNMPVWLGASCVVALLGTSLFSQNVIARHSLDTSTLDAGTVNVAQGYDHFTRGLSGNTFGDQGPSAQMASYGNFGFAYATNFIRGFSNFPSDDLSLNGQAWCNKSNCTFEPFDTLRICAHCADISREVNRESGRLSLRSDLLSLDVENGIVNLTSDTNYPDWDWLSVNAPAPLLVHYFALTQVRAQNASPAAIECAAYWCVATYDSYRSNSLVYEVPRIVNTSSAGTPKDLNNAAITNHSASALTHYGLENDIYIRPDICHLGNKSFTDAKHCTFRVTAETQLGLQNFLSKRYFGMPPLLTGSQESIGGPNGTEWRTSSFAANALGSVCYNGDDYCMDHRAEGIGTSFTNLTQFMSNVIRKTLGHGTGYISGTSHEFHQVYHIR